MKHLLQEVYDFDINDNSFIIKIAPEKYVDLFNKLDHYPIKKRDIDQNVITYIEDCSSDIPLNRKSKIEIMIKDDMQNNELEQRTTKGMNSYFKYSLLYYKNQEMNIFKESSIYFVLFIVITLFTFYLEKNIIN